MDWLSCSRYSPKVPALTGNWRETAPLAPGWDPLTATESSGRQITYSHSEEDAALFGIEPKGKMDRNRRVGQFRPVTNKAY